MEEGVFDNLAGRGRPLDLEENPYEDPSLRMGYRLLRNNGFAPAWMEEAKDLERAVETLRRDLRRGLRASGSRQPTQDALRLRVGEINRRILARNLKTPSASFHMRPVDMAELIADKP